MLKFIEDCKNKALEIGVIIDTPATDGILHRTGTVDKPNSKNGVYLAFGDEPYSMWVKNWSTGQEATFTAKSEGSMSKEERAAFNARAKAEREQREADRQARNLEAAQKAQDILSNAQSATNAHHYLAKKQVPGFGLFLGRDNALIVPVLDEQGKAQSLQFIPPDGKGKRFLSGGKMAGGFFPIPAKDGSKDCPLCIAEGYATAASIHLATGYACLVAFNAGNLETVAKMARQRYPNRIIIICADNDHSTSDNVGIAKATTAAQTINALLAIPPIIEGSKATDFNDLHIAQGLEAVKACIDSAENNQTQDTKQKQNLCVVGIRELLELEVPPRHYLLHPIVPEQGLCMVFADRGIGKTFTALHMAYAIATGGQVFSWQSEQAWPVLYVDGEMPFSAMQSRIAALVVSADKEPQEGFFNVLTPDLQNDDTPMPNLATKEGQAALEPYLQGIKLVVIDNLSTLCRGGRSNDEESWLPVQEWVLGLRRRGISVLIVHHASKNGSQRGTSAKEDILDTVIQLRRPKDYNPEQGARFEVHLTKARGIFGADAEPFEAQLVTIDNIATWTVKSIEDARVEQIRNLAADGLTQRDIADELGIPKSTVNRLCKKHDIATKGGSK